MPHRHPTFVFVRAIEQGEEPLAASQARPVNVVGPNGLHPAVSHRFLPFRAVGPANLPMLLVADDDMARFVNHRFPLGLVGRPRPQRDRESYSGTECVRVVRGIPHLSSKSRVELDHDQLGEFGNRIAFTSEPDPLLDVPVAHRHSSLNLRRFSRNRWVPLAEGQEEEGDGRVVGGCGCRVGLPPLGGVGYNDRMTTASSGRWFVPTPGRLLPVLLAVEGFLWLSERFRWFAFNQHKGWTVLIAVASVGVFLLLMFL